MTNSQKGIGTPVIIGIVAIILIAAIGGYFFLSQSQNNTETLVEEETVEGPTPMDGIDTENMPRATDEAMMEGTDSAEVAPGTIEVTGENFEFSTDEIRVKAGQPVTLKFTSTNGFHDWVVDEIPGAKTKQINTGQSDTITFTPTQKGTFEFYCSVGQHRQMGMVGNLIVE